MFALAACAIGIALVGGGVRRRRPHPGAARSALLRVRRGAHLHPGAQAAGMSAFPGLGWRARPRAAATRLQRSRRVRWRSLRRSVGSPLLFSIVYPSLASAIYFALGVIAGHALGLTPLVFLVAALMFALTAHDLRRGRLAAPGAGRLDRVRPLRVQRAGELHRRLGAAPGLRDPDRDHDLHRDPVPARVLEHARARGRRRSAWHSRSSHSSCSRTFAVSAGAARGASARSWSPISRCRRSSSCSGSCCSSTPTCSSSSIHLGSAPTWSGLVFALTLTAIAFTGLETASGLGRRGEGRSPRPEAGRQGEH